MKNKTADILGILITALLVISSGYAGCTGCGNKTTTPPVIDHTPRAEILMPGAGQTEYTQGESITFAGIHIGEDTCGAACSYTWSSSLDGVLGTGVSISRNNLSAGQHIIEFTFSDGKGTIMTAKKDITIKPSSLQARIVLPAAETFYNETDNIPFNASVSGGVPPYTYSWRLDDKVIGSVKYLEIKDEAGIHTVRLEVKDAANSYKTEDETLWIIKPADIEIPPLKASIKTPKNRQTVKEGSTLKFTAEAAGGKEPYTYSWESDVNGLISREKEFNYSILSRDENGSNTITLRVSDSAGFAVSDKITLTIALICNHDKKCHTGENYYNCPDDCPSGGKDGVCDGVSDKRCDQDCKQGEDPDCECNKDGFCDVGTENYYNCPADCPSGTQDGTCDKVKDGRCDQDCKQGEDPDCVKGDDGKYILLLILVAAIFLVYMRFIRRG
jgi:hypothetical protein